MSVAQLNRWLNGMAPQAESIAALDKVLQPIPVTAEEAAEARRTAGPGNPIHFRPVTGAVLRDAKPASCSFDSWRNLLRRVYNRTPEGVYTNLATCWCYAGIFSDGPKVYCPTLEEFEGLARVELRVPVSLYRQPFPTTFIVIPDGAFGTVSEAVGVPQFIAVRHWVADRDQGGLIAGFIVGDVQQTYELDFRIAWIDDGAEHIEARLKAIDDASKTFEPFGEAYRLAADEPAAMEKIKRAALNACLLLSQHAPRPLGRANPEHAAKLMAKLGKRLPPHVQAANAKQLQLMPMLYGFHQHIKVVERETEDDPTGTGTCPARTPHWRRGHWANLAVGVGRKDHRLHFRAAKLVNEHLLQGPRGNTRVTMTTV